MPISTPGPNWKQENHDYSAERSGVVDDERPLLDSTLFDLDWLDEEEPQPERGDFWIDVEDDLES